MSHSLIAIEEVRVPLYHGHSEWKAELIRLVSLPYPSLIQKRYPFTAGLTERVLQSSFSTLLLSLVCSTDTWGQLVLLTTILNHKTCLNTSRQVLEKTLFAINAIFTQDNNLSKKKVEGSLQKTNATCSKCKTNLLPLQRRYNAGDGSHKIEPRYKWYRAITTSALSAPPTNPKTSRLPVRTMYLIITRQIKVFTACLTQRKSSLK